MCVGCGLIYVLVIVIGSSRVLSGSCSWVNEYISIIYELVFGDVLCCLMGDMEGGKWMGEGVSIGGCLVFLWPNIAGLAGANTWFGHKSVCWGAGVATSLLPLFWWLMNLVGVSSGVESGIGADAAHREDDDVPSRFAGLLVVGAEVSDVISSCKLINFQKSSP